MQTIVALELAIWAPAPLEVLPVHVLITVAGIGGQVLGAFADAGLVAMSVGLPAWRDGHRILWSHMAGVLPRYQGAGVGTALKLRQRELARAAGFRSIHWTFDPLQRGNANFNFRLPGLQVARYHANRYGEMDDGINAGLPSDRLEANWPTRAAAQRPASLTSTAQLLLLADARGRPLARALPDAGAPTGIEIPRALAELKRDNPSLALEWRLATRAAFQSALAQGYRATAFREQEGRAFYLLETPPPCFLYVLRCRDDSLYAGVSVDLARRLNQHNAGRGAAYTAARRPLQLLASWRYPGRATAQRAEAAFKKLRRPAKLALIQSGAPWQNGSRQHL